MTCTKLDIFKIKVMIEPELESKTRTDMEASIIRLLRESWLDQTTEIHNITFTFILTLFRPGFENPYSGQGGAEKAPPL